jgi:hypothetical protein
MMNFKHFKIWVAAGESRLANRMIKRAVTEKANHKKIE